VELTLPSIAKPQAAFGELAAPTMLVVVPTCRLRERALPLGENSSTVTVASVPVKAPEDESSMKPLPLGE